MSLRAQDNSATTLKLTDLSDFKSQAGNWQIVGDVTIDPTTDIHAHAESKPVISEPKKKGKKTTAVAAPQAKSQPVTFRNGQGVLLNMNDETKKDNLLSTFEHGDIELEFEVMLPKGSNSGVYLQGRYEVQLLDSWGVKNPSFSDIGGIYRNWEKEQGKIYMGKAPLTNPAKAPGLWQKFSISFKAPRFDKSGKKISNAKFIYVDLNGVRIHDNVEVPLPTGGPVENNEKAMGPLMIQGDHGPVAFRNIKYRLMRELNVSLSDVAYRTYNGNFKTISDFESLKPATSGTSADLTCEVLSNEDLYGAAYSGKINVPEDGNYQFVLAYSGGGRLVISGKEVINVQRPDGWEQSKGWLELKAGTYTFEIHNFKAASWMPPRLGFFVQTETSYLQTLSAFTSYPPDDDPVSRILVDAGSEPRLLRAFVDFKGDRSQRLTHTIGVGDPNGTHYVYDLKSGNIVCVWHGNFVDATYMWHDRGDGSFRPRGAAQFLFNNQPLAFLSSDQEAFPTHSNDALIQPGGHKSTGYSIDANGRPVFTYTYQSLDVEDRIYPDDDNKVITHEIFIRNRGTKTGLYYKLGEGYEITQIRDGIYAVDDKQYYIKIAGVVPVIRESNGRKELVVPVDSHIKYSILW